MSNEKLELIKQMAMAYLNNLRVRENQLLQDISNLKREIEICEAALREDIENVNLDEDIA